MIDILDLHQRMTKHLFPAWSAEDRHFLSLALCGEVGEIANKIKKEWRDGCDLTEEIRDELADARVYLELLANCYGIPGALLNLRVQTKLQKVVERRKGADPASEDRA